MLICGGRDPALALHRLVAGAPPGWRVRHQNGNKLDNRRENLVVVPHGEVRPTAGRAGFAPEARQDVRRRVYAGGRQGRG